MIDTRTNGRQSKDRKARREALNRRVDAGELLPPEILKQMRDLLNMSQSAYAKMVKVSPKTLIQFESGEGNPTLETLKKIFAPFGFELNLKRRTRLQTDGLSSTLGSTLKAELSEAAKSQGLTLSDGLAEAVRLYLSLPSRIQERSWRLGVSEGWMAAKDWIHRREQFWQGISERPNLIDELKDIEQRFESIAKAEGQQAQSLSWKSMDRDWPTANDAVVNVKWQLQIGGDLGAVVPIEGEPKVGEFAYDQGKYFVISDRKLLGPERRILVLTAIEDSVGMRALRKTSPERFRKVPTRG